MIENNYNIVKNKRTESKDISNKAKKPIKTLETCSNSG